MITQYLTKYSMSKKSHLRPLELKKNSLCYQFALWVRDKIYE